MVTFVIETFVPGGATTAFAADGAGIRRAIRQIETGRGVRYFRAYLVPGDEMGFHVLEAASADDVARVAALAGIEVERIVEAVGIEPSAD